jgi:hypothetical protein
MSDEEKRRKLQGYVRDLLLLDSQAAEVSDRVDKIKKKVEEMYLEVDNKLDTEGK